MKSAKIILLSRDIYIVDTEGTNIGNKQGVESCSGVSFDLMQ